MSMFWDGIVDASVEPPYVWFSREKDTDEWKPLRKEDCRVLNSSSSEEVEVFIESGRVSANLKTMTITHLFFNFPDRKLCKAAWFVIKNAKGLILDPVLPFEDACKIEDLYKEAVKSCNSLATEKDKSLEDVMLSSPGNFKVVVSRSSDRICLRKKQATGFGAILDKGKLLQRGFGNYDVKGEDIESSLGPVEHLIFVVHGIGEAVWSSSESIASLKEELTRMRETMQKKQIDDWKVACEKQKQKKIKDPESTEPPKPNRIEIIPIEWYDRIHSSSNSLMKSLNSVTLNSIPSLRSVANDVVFDVLMYMTPEFCEATLECVTTQINEKYAKFKSIHPHFDTEDGNCKISIIGHSLGSVIVWDLLSIRKLLLGEKMDETKKRKTLVSGFSVFEEDDNEGDENCAPKRTETWAPSLPKKMTKHIDFEPEHTYFLGSPLGCMLTLRGAHEEFDEMITLVNNIKEGTTTNEEETKENSELGLENPFEESNDNEDDEENKEENNDDNRVVNEDSEDIEVVKVVSAAVSAELSSKEKNSEAKLLQKEKRKSTLSKQKDGSKGNSIDLSGMVSPFTLPTKYLYNVFHPSDPVAYRLEPLLLPRHLKKDDIPAPLVLATESKGVRLHIKAKQFHKGMSKNIDSWFGGSKRNLVEDKDKASSTNNETMSMAPQFFLSDESLDFPIGGNNKRVDFELQVGLIDNEYLSAVSAHTSYWVNEDLVEFIIQHASMK